MLRYLPKYYINKAIAFYVMLLVVAPILFGVRELPAIPLIFGLIQVVCFFYFTHHFSIKWVNLPPTILVKKILWHSLFIRIVYVFASYFFYLSMTGQPFEFNAADSMGYHLEASWFVALINNGSLLEYLAQKSGVSDSGYSIYLSVVYYFTDNSIIVARLLKAILSAYTAVLIYKIAYRNFGESAGCLAGIMAMLLPNFIYYSGMHVKETEMLFLTVAFAERADYVIKSPRLKLKPILATLIFAFSLFFFRTVLGAAAVFSFLVGTLLTRTRYLSKGKRVRIIIALVVFTTLISGSSLIGEVERYWSAKVTNQKLGMAQRHKGSSLLKYARTTVFAPAILIAPFPTLINIPSQQNSMHINGAVFTRNCYIFFVFIALLALVKKQRYRQHMFILLFMLTYLFILASSTFAFSERFHLPALPFLIILAAYGITIINKQKRKYYLPYLICISIVIIGWTWIKLLRRGLI